MQPPPLKIFIDISGHDYWFSKELEGMLEIMSASATADAVLATRIEAADCVLRVGGCPALTDRLSRCFGWSEEKSPREFVWEMGDLPTGAMPGFYSSLPSYMYDHRRHRAFCLPVRCNEVVQAYDLSDARFLFGFFGAVTSGLRARMIPVLRKVSNESEALLVVRDSIWLQMYDRSGIEAKEQYADNLRRCQFILCPRGNVLAGAGSRLYETMQAARVPVIVSDWITLPAGVDWNSCAIRVRERDIAQLPKILRQYSGRWPEMALNARRYWESHFSQKAQLGELGRQLRLLLAWSGEKRITTRLCSGARVALGLAALKPRQYSMHAHKIRKLWLKISGRS